MNKRVLVSALILMAIVLSGCGQKIAERGIENNLENALGQNVDVNLDQESVKIEGEDGSIINAGQGTKLPESFPNDVYIVDGDIMGAIENVGMVGYQVTISTNKKIDEIKKIYQERVVVDNWEINSTMDTPEMFMLIGAKDSRALTVAVTVDENDVSKSVVSITVQQSN